MKFFKSSKKDKKGGIGGTGGGGSGKKDKDIKPLYDPRTKSQREALAAWHREGIEVTEYYDVIKVLGQGHLGEVSIVARKPEWKKSHSRSISSSSLPRRSTSSLSGCGDNADLVRSRSTDSGASVEGATTETTADGVEIDMKVGTPTRVKFLNDSPTKSSSPPPEDGVAAAASPPPPAAGRADQRSEDGRRLFACKTVTTARMKSDQQEELLNEIEIMRQLDHPHILQLFEVYRVKRKMWLVTELCTGGDLFARMPLDEPDAAIVMEQILQAVAYMHQRGVCHRDLKLENILYEHPGPDSDIKLIDFGLSQRFGMGEKMRQACGTMYTVAPEMITSTKGYTEKTDVFSIGCISFILLSGDFPFLMNAEDLNNEAKRDRLLHAKYVFGPAWKERSISKAGREFVYGCIRKHPAMRWSASEALQFVEDTWIDALEKEQLPKVDEGDSAAAAAAAVDDAEPNVFRRSTVVKRRSTRMASLTLEGMKEFCNHGLLKKTILMTMALTMDKSTLGELSELFLAMDSENTGTISLVEMRDALNRFFAHRDDVDEKMITDLFRGIDHDKSGQVHYSEFLAAVAESQGLITLERLQDAFDRIDTEGKGYISRENLHEILGTDYNEELVNKMIEEADYKKNGRVDYEEFLSLMFQDPAAALDIVPSTSVDQ